jgi:DNA/RNA-binding protein KIN17
MCQKQCRDENGFKCHCSSESHQRQMALFAANPGKFLDSFSSEFEATFLRHLKHSHGTKRVFANHVYNELIKDRHHLHMNATKWSTLSGFVRYLGKTGKCVVDETPKGWYIAYIDRDPQVIARQKALERKKQADLDEEQRERERIEKQLEEVKKYEGESSGSAAVDDLAGESEAKKVAFSLSLAPLAKSKPKETVPQPVGPAQAQQEQELEHEHKEEQEEGEGEREGEREGAPLLMTSSTQSNEDGKPAEKGEKRKAHHLESHKDKNDRQKPEDRKRYRSSSPSPPPPSHSERPTDRHSHRNRNSHTDRDRDRDRERDGERDGHREAHRDKEKDKRKGRWDQRHKSSSHTAPGTGAGSRVAGSGGERRAPSALEEIMKIEERKKERLNRFDYWLTEGIIVKVKHKEVGGGKYYNQKGQVTQVEGRYVALVQMLDSGDVLRLDQDYLETVLPALGGTVKVLNGAYRGQTASLKAIDVDNYCATITISSGMHMGTTITGVDYADIAKYAPVQ